MVNQPLDVDREQVKMLVLAVGCTEAAKQTGIALNTILSWSARGEWLKPVKQVLPPHMQPRAISAIKPADALRDFMQEGYAKTKIGQVKYLSRASTKLSETPDNQLLAEAQTGKALADMAAKVFPESSAQVKLSMDDSPLLDVDAEYVPDTQQDTPA